MPDFLPLEKAKKKNTDLQLCSSSAIWLGGFHIICHSGFSSPTAENCTDEVEGKYKAF